MTRLALLLVASLASTASAEVELKNDGFVSNGTASFQTGFVGGEAGAARFVAPSAGRRLEKIQFLFGGAATMQTLTLRVFDDTAGTDDPGSEVFMGEFEITGSDSAMQELDVRTENIIVPAQFRVALELQHNGLPSIAADGDATIMRDRNFIRASGIGWKKSADLGLTGDWVIRAFVSDVNDPDLGEFCDVDTECAPGEYCFVDHHLCTAGCRVDDDCSAGTCSNHQCTGGSTDDGGCRTSSGTGARFAFGALALLLALVRGRRAASRP